MKTLLILFAVGLALLACDSQPTKAPVLDQAPQAEPAPKPASGGEQPPPAQ